MALAVQKDQWVRTTSRHLGGASPYRREKSSDRGAFYLGSPSSTEFDLRRTATRLAVNQRILHKARHRLLQASPGIGASGLMRPARRRSAQKSAGTTSFSAALSSAMRLGRLAPGITAAT